MMMMMMMIRNLFLLQLLAEMATGFVPVHPRRDNTAWRKIPRMASTTTESSSSTSTTTTMTERDVKVQQVLALAREFGPIGAFAKEQDQRRILELARGLAPYSDPNPPSGAPYRGVHNLVYSDSTGGSSGKLFGPFYGHVTQTFLDDNETFVNTVEIGPFQLALRAQRQVVDDHTNRVTFREINAKAFGQTLVQKDITGGGMWNYIFHGTIVDADGTSKLVRVMEAPSLFVIEQPVP